MPRASKTGVQGLQRFQRREPSTGKLETRYRIDLRWNDPRTGERRRYQELLPRHIKAPEAKRRARSAVNAAYAGELTKANARGDSPPQRLHEALDEYVTWSETNRPRTYRDRKGIVAKLKQHLGDVKLGELSPFAVEKLKRTRSKAVKPATVNREVAQLKRAVGLWASWGWMDEAQAQRIRNVPMLKEPPGRVREVTDAEWKALEKALKKKPDAVRHIVLGAMLSGLRRTNIVRLRRDEVDLNRRQLTIGQTKNGEALRLPISDGLRDVLKVALKRSKHSTYVFVNEDGEPYTPDGFSTLWQRTKREAKVQDLRFHDLRHDFASKVRRNGAGLDVVARLLGHSSLAMARRYAHIGDAELQEAVNAVPVRG